MTTAFHRFCDGLRDHNVPFRVPRLVGRQQAKLHYNDVKDGVLFRLSQPHTYVTIGIDVWTNVVTDHVINVMLFGGGRWYYWTSLYCYEDHCDSLWIEQQMNPIIAELKAKGVKLVAIVADNGGADNSARTNLPEKYQLISVPCSGHTLQLVVKKVLAVPAVNAVLNFWGNIASNYTKNGSHVQRVALMRLTSGKKLRKAVVTRWNSQLFALERAREIFERLVTVGSQYAEVLIPEPVQTLAQLDDLISMLKPFQLMTEALQSDAANLTTVMEAWYRMSKHAAEVADQLQTAEMKANDWNSAAPTSISSVIRAKWKKQTATSSVRVLYELSFGTSTRLFTSAVATSDIRQVLYRVLLAVAPDDLLSNYHPPGEQLEHALMKQYVAFTNHQGNFAHNLAESKGWKPTTEQLANYWTVRRSYNDTALLAYTAFGLMSINPSEAAVERSFSAQDQMHNNLTNRMFEDIVKSMMFIKVNVPSLNNTTPTMEVTWRDVEEADGAVEEADD